MERIKFENGIDKLWDKMYSVKASAREYINEFFKAYGIKSLNMKAYIKEGYVDNYFFYDFVDDSPIAYSIDNIVYMGGYADIMVTMVTNEGDCEAVYSYSDFNPQELLYLADMLSMVLARHEDSGIPFLQNGEEFE